MARVGGASAGTLWRVHREDGATTIQEEPHSDGLVGADKASVISTLDDLEAAVVTGAWIDVTVDPVLGVPLLAAVDPSSSVDGDEYWIELSFHNLEWERANHAVDVARATWSAAHLRHFSYRWRYRGDHDPLTYRVSMDGDVATLEREPGTPVPEAKAYAAPRMDDTFQMIVDVLAQGGRVDATYDAHLGYPARVEMEPAGDAGAPGVITIDEFHAP